MVAFAFSVFFDVVSLYYTFKSNGNKKTVKVNSAPSISSVVGSAGASAVFTFLPGARYMTQNKEVVLEEGGICWARVNKIEFQEGEVAEASEEPKEENQKKERKFFKPC